MPIQCLAFQNPSRKEECERLAIAQSITRLILAHPVYYPETHASPAHSPGKRARRENQGPPRTWHSSHHLTPPPSSKHRSPLTAHAHCPTIYSLHYPPAHRRPVSIKIYPPCRRPPKQNNTDYQRKQEDRPAKRNDQIQKATPSRCSSQRYAKRFKDRYPQSILLNDAPRPSYETRRKWNAGRERDLNPGIWWRGPTT